MDGRIRTREERRKRGRGKYGERKEREERMWVLRKGERVEVVGGIAGGGCLGEGGGAERMGGDVGVPSAVNSTANLQ